MRCCRASLTLVMVASSCLVGGMIAGAVPDEIVNLSFTDTATLSWDPDPAAATYNVYRGSSGPPRCHGWRIGDTSFSSPATPDTGAAFFYLVTGESLDGEGSPGLDSDLAVRPLSGRCEPVMRKHVQDRLGYGSDEWTTERIATLGIEDYIAEQLAPATIDETTNTELKARTTPYDPPVDIIELIALQVVTGTYARRQLEQQVASFWANHFNTFWRKAADLYQGAYPDCNSGLPQCDPDYPAQAYLEATLAQQREFEEFRALAFDGNFREILEASAKSPAMILFLDTYANLASAPNENYARELLELYAMGVDGGYTQQDVEEMARVLTGWTICKKKLNALDDPLAACIDTYWLPEPLGEWVSLFVTDRHDCDAKVLFQGTPHEASIPSTCASPDDGVQDLDLALDAIAAHPSSARFLVRKLIERFVTDSPDESMIDDVVAVWNDVSNPHGAGDLSAVLEAILTSPGFLDPDRVRTKIKTPFEHFVSATRAIRGMTDGQEVVLQYLVNAQHLPHYNPVPTGWPERGGAWIDTTNTLERQNFCLYLSAFDATEFGSDPIGLLEDSGVSTAPGNAEAIIDGLADLLFAGALAPHERQMALDFLNTDINGTPSPYDDTRIRRVAGFLLGYAQFQEQ